MKYTMYIRQQLTELHGRLVAAITIRNELTEIGVLVLSQYIEGSFATELLADNASGFGYLLKDRVVNVTQFLDALTRVASGGSALDPEIVSRLMGHYEKDHSLDVLTKREHEVLGLMTEGRTNRAIAEQLVITQRAANSNVLPVFNRAAVMQSPTVRSKL